MNDLLKEMRELIQKLNEASKAYYQEAREIMSNFEYDALYDRLLALEKETGTVLADSPSIHVGYEVLSELPKENHDSPMPVSYTHLTGRKRDLFCIAGNRPGERQTKTDFLY